MQDRLAGRYVLGAELGRGGMARVVAARDLRLHREVAVKLLPISAAEPSPERQRFVREARAAAAFTHPHAVAIFDAGVADDVLFIVMELVDGETVATRVARQGALDVAAAVRITDEVLQALGAAHRAGIVHRDVKPGNVLLTADGAAKLADFGIAKRLDDGAADVTVAGLVIGTPSYLAPEQLTGGAVTPAVDIYASGVLLFEMLTGRKPFAGSSPIEIAMARRTSGPPDVAALRADVPSHVAAAVRTALAEDPGDRFPSAEAMRTALREAAVTTPAASRPLPPPRAVAPTTVMPATGRARRRHVWWWAALVGVLAVGVAALALGRDTDPPAAGTTTSVAAPAPAPPTSPTPTTLAPTTVAATTPPTAAAPTAPPPTTAPPPADLDALAALIAADPARFGVHAEQLQRDVARLADREGRQQARDVERLRSRLEAWATDGSLPPEAADLIGSLLPAPEGDEGPGDEGD